MAWPLAGAPLTLHAVVTALVVPPATASATPAPNPSEPTDESAHRCAAHYA